MGIEEGLDVERRKSMKEELDTLFETLRNCSYPISIVKIM
jgi:hypothetical protein